MLLILTNIMRHWLASFFHCVRYFKTIMKGGGVSIGWVWPCLLSKSYSLERVINFTRIPKDNRIYFGQKDNGVFDFTSEPGFEHNKMYGTVIFTSDKKQALELVGRLLDSELCVTISNPFTDYRTVIDQFTSQFYEQYSRF